MVGQRTGANLAGAPGYHCVAAGGSRRPFGDDYDAALWNGRAAKLKPAARQPAEADAVKFDLALTVCLMRYISDLHIGKVNPKHFAFALDEEPRKYDLAEFLKDRVAGASDVSAVLAEVEPPYPGYRNTIQALQTYMKLAAQDDGEQLPPPAPPKKAIAPGDAYPGVPRLARLLRLVATLGRTQASPRAARFTMARSSTP